MNHALLLKAASLGTAEAAAAIARVAADTRARGPLVKAGELDPQTMELLKRTAIGAGVGGAGMGLMGLMQGRKPRAALRSALGGALGGAAIGGASHLLPQAMQAGANPTSTDPELLEAWNRKWLPEKLFRRAFTMGEYGRVPEIANESVRNDLARGPSLFEGVSDLTHGGAEGGEGGGLAGLASSAAGGVGDVARFGGDYAKYHPLSTGAMGLNAVHDARRYVKGKQLEPVMQTIRGLEAIKDNDPLKSLADQWRSGLAERHGLLEHERFFSPWRTTKPVLGAMPPDLLQRAMSAGSAAIKADKDIGRVFRPRIGGRFRYIAPFLAGLAGRF